MSKEQNKVSEQLTISEKRKVFVVWTNMDLTEGRGGDFVMTVCEKPTTALRVGKGRYVQGTNCPITESFAFRIGTKWFVPGRIIKPSKEDKAIEERLALRTVAVNKAKAAGLTDDDIARIENLL